MKDLDIKVDSNAISTGQGDGDNLRATGRGLLDKESVRFNSVQMEESRHKDESRNTDKGRAATQAMKDFIPKGSPLRLSHYSWGLFNRAITDVERVIDGVPIDMQFVGMDQGLTDYNTTYGSHSDPIKHKDYSAHLSDHAPAFIGGRVDLLSIEEYEEVANNLNNFTEVHNKFQEGNATQQELDAAMVRAYKDRSKVARFRQMAFLNWGDGDKDDRWDRTLRNAMEIAATPEAIKGYNLAQANQRMVQTGWTPPIPEAGFWKTQAVAFDKFHFFNALAEKSQLDTARRHGKKLSMDEQDILAGVPQKFHAKLRQEMSEFNDSSAWIMRNQLMNDVENDRIYDNLAWYAQIGYAVPSFFTDPLTVVPGIGAAKVVTRVHAMARTWKASPMLKNTAIISSYTALGVPEGLISNAPQLMQDHTYTINDWYMDGVVDGAFATTLGVAGRFGARPMWRQHKLNKILKRKRQLEVHEMQEHIQVEMESRGQTPKKVRTKAEQQLFNQKMKAYLKAKHEQKLYRTRKPFAEWVRGIEMPNRRKAFKLSNVFRVRDEAYTADRKRLQSDIKAAKAKREEVAAKLGIARKTHNRRPNAHVDAARREHHKTVHEAGDTARLQSEYHDLNKTIDSYMDALTETRNAHRELKNDNKLKGEPQTFTPLSAVSKVSSSGFRQMVDSITDVFPKMGKNHPVVRLMNSQKGLNARVTLKAMPEGLTKEIERLEQLPQKLHSTKKQLRALQIQKNRIDEHNKSTTERLKVVHELNALVLKIAATFPDGKITKGMMDAIDAVSNMQKNYTTVSAMDSLVRGDITDAGIEQYADRLANLDIFDEQAWVPLSAADFKEMYSFALSQYDEVTDPTSPNFDADILFGQSQQHSGVTSQVKDILQANENVAEHGTQRSKDAMEQINGLMAYRLDQIEHAGKSTGKLGTSNMRPALETLTVKQLKNILRVMKKEDKSVKVSGNKSTLMYRIYNVWGKQDFQDYLKPSDAPIHAAIVQELMDAGMTRQTVNKLLDGAIDGVHEPAPKYQDSTKRYEDTQAMTLSDAIARVESEGIPPMTDAYSDRLHELLDGGRIRTSEEIKRLGREDPIEGDPESDALGSYAEADIRQGEGSEDFIDAEIEQDLFDMHVPQDKVKPIKDIKENAEQAPLPRSYTNVTEQDIYSRDYTGDLTLNELELLRDRIRESIVDKLNANELKIVKETKAQLKRLKQTKAALLVDKTRVVNRMIQSRTIDAVTLVLRAAEEIRAEAKVTEAKKAWNESDMPMIEQMRKNDIADEVDVEYKERLDKLEAEAEVVRERIDGLRENPKFEESRVRGEHIETLEKQMADNEASIKAIENEVHKHGKKVGLSTRDTVTVINPDGTKSHYKQLSRAKTKKIAEHELKIVELEQQAAKLRAEHFEPEVKDKPEVDTTYAKDGADAIKLAEARRDRILKEQAENDKLSTEDAQNMSSYYTYELELVDKFLEKARKPKPKAKKLYKAPVLRIKQLIKQTNDAIRGEGERLARINDRISQTHEQLEGDIEARFDNPDYHPRKKYEEDLAALRADVQKHRDIATGDSNQTTKKPKKDAKPEAEAPKPKPPKNLVEEDLDDTVDGTNSDKDPAEKLDVDAQKNAAYDKLAAEAAEGAHKFQTDFVANGDQELMEYAVKTLSNATDAIGRALSRWTKDMATKMMESKLTSVQALGFNITEVGRGFAGRVRRRRTGALIRDKVYKELASKTHPAYVHSLNAYAASKDKAAFGRMNAQQMSGEQMELVQRFNEEVFSIQELRRQGKPIPDTISPITQKYIDDVDAMFSHAHDRLVEAGIDGFTKKNKVKHYIPHVWQRGKLQGMISKRGMPFVEKLFTKAFLEAPAMGQKAYDQAGAEKAAKRHIKWIMEQDGSNSYEDQHLPITDSRSKHRRDLNTLAEIDGVKLMDLLDTDLISVQDKYSHRVAGWVGLAESTNGTLSSDLKIHAYKESIIQEGKEKGVDTRKMEQWYDDLIDQMFGRPTRTFFEGTFMDKFMTKHLTGTDAKAVHKGLPNELRQLKDSTALALMGGLGTAQLIETGQVMTRGMLNVFSDPKVIKLMFKMAGEDIDSPGIMQQIEEMSSISNNIEWWDRQSVHLDQQQLDEVGIIRKASLRIADAVTLGKYKAPASRLLGKTTGYNLIKKYQTRLVQASFALDVTNHFTKGTGKMSKARLADLGLTDINGIDAELHHAFNTHVEVDPKTGAILDLHPDLWEKSAREKFQYAMLRDEAQQIQRTHIGELPVWMNRPLMGLLFQFRQMPLVAQNKQLARSMAFADQEAVMSLMLNAAMAGTVRYSKFAALGLVAEAITGDEWEEPYAGVDGTDGSKWVGDSAKYMVQFGMMADAYDLVLGENQPEVKNWMDAGSRALGTIPSLSVAEQYRKLGQGVVTADIQTAVDGASGSTALSNTLYGDIFFQGVKEMVDGWEDGKQ